MRIWSLHPGHLDRAGLVAAWREALLAQAVLAGRTRGYRHHPQLVRFRRTPHPIEAIGAYLRGLHEEAARRGYRFDGSRILESAASPARLPVTRGQLDYEWAHLGEKLARRSPDDAERWRDSSPTPHPLFEPIAGDVESWERP
jgi:hypothetical protein